MQTAMIRVQIASARVGSTRWAISSATVFLKKKLSPKLPLQHVADPDARTAARSAGSRPSLARMSAIWSEVALSPAITAAGSPGVSRSMRKTNTATTARTGMMATRRRAMKSSIGSLSGQPMRGLPLPAASVRRGRRRGRPRASLLLDVPHHRHRRLQPAADVGAHGARSVPLADPAVLRGLDARGPAPRAASALALAGSVSLA